MRSALNQVLFLLIMTPGLVQSFARITDWLVRECGASYLPTELLHTTRPHLLTAILACSERPTGNKRVHGVYRLQEYLVRIHFEACL